MDVAKTEGRPRTILLLGGTGFIGGNLTRELVTAGHRVLVTGRRPVDLPGAVQVRQLRLREVDATLAMVEENRVNTVVHLVSSMIPSSTEADYLSEQDTVALPTLRLARRLADRGVDLVFMSSGGTVYGALPSAAAGEDDRCAPISFYGRAKLGIEHDLQFVSRTHGLRSLIVRPSNPYGPGQSLQGVQGLISVILGRMREGRPLEVWGDGSTVRDYIYIDDFTRSVRDLIERDVRGTIINVGSGAGHALIDVVRTAEQVTGRTLELEFKPHRAADVPRLVLDVERLHALGMAHARSLEEGIGAYAAALGMVADD